MNIIEVNRDPSRRDLFWFAVMLFVFAAVLGGLVMFKGGEGLAGVSIILATAWLLSLFFNPAEKKTQLLGILLPSLCAAISWPVAKGIVGKAEMAITVSSIGTCAAVAAWVFPVFARKVYLGWMLAALPIGWSISHGLLAVLYYMIVTPIGLIMRIVGRDPMHRHIEKERDSYWVQRPSSIETSRYFRQY